jgi:hypothetical protein
MAFPRRRMTEPSVSRISEECATNPVIEGDVARGRRASGGCRHADRDEESRLERRLRYAEGGGGGISLARMVPRRDEQDVRLSRLRKSILIQGQDSVDLGFSLGFPNQDFGNVRRVRSGDAHSFVL